MTVCYTFDWNLTDLKKKDSFYRVTVALIKADHLSCNTARHDDLIWYKCK